MNNKDRKNSAEFWKSLKEYYGDPKILKAKNNEFMDGVTDEFDPDEMSGVSRRKFLALLTASAAFSVTACTDYRDKGEIIPYNDRPEGVLPGKPNYYASTCDGCAERCGLLVKTREGRPIKLEGNPDNPINKGKLCTKGHASILNLYDPERLTSPLRDKRKTSWSEIDRVVIENLKAAVENGKEISIVSHSIYSSTTKRVLDEFKQKFPTVKFYSYELHSDETKRNAWEKTYGSRILPAIKLDDAKVVLSLDNDLLGRDGNTLENSRLYSAHRDIMKTDNFNRLYVVEGGMSLTGMNADYRFRLRPDAQSEFVLSLLSELKKLSAFEFSVDADLSGYSLDQFCEKYGLSRKKIGLMVEDLILHKGESIVLAGETLDENTHILVNLLNEVLKNQSLYDYKNGYAEKKKLSGYSEIRSLVKEMNDGKVAAVIHFDSNPVYHFPADIGYAKALQNVNTTITFTENENETSELSNFVLPINNFLESWGEYQTRNSFISLQQPVISPLFKSRQKEAILMTWMFGSPDAFSEEMYHKYLMDNIKENVYNKKNTDVNFENFWYASLHDGLIPLDNFEETKTEFNQSVIPEKKDITKAEGIVLHLQKNYFIGDGKFANNGWLQEMPHPVSKVAWDNYAAISPAMAKKMNLSINDKIEIKTESGNITIPVMIQPGTAEDLIVVETGYGRSVCGDVGKDVGFNTNAIVTGNNGTPEFIYSNVSVSKSSGTHELVSTQEHHALDDTFTKDFHLKRKIIKEGTLEQYKNDHEFLHHGKHDIFSITKSHKYTGNKWAMAIDLNKCISCGVCVTSCNVENNVPVVGKDQVAKGREMQWMRIDRYYSGTPEEPVVSNQPMLCQHCDNAPCENVCPVNATNHSPDGLNQMAYNRCVGTRYCANNCPYKVRRFNFYNFRDHFADAYYLNDLTALVNNPEVTVRSRGVMEKCTFCVQRIMEARSEAIKENREIGGNEVETACQQACPTQAIVFGDSNNAEAEVVKYREHDLGYHVLDYLNVVPNVTYIAKLRNRHSEDA